MGVVPCRFPSKISRQFSVTRWRSQRRTSAPRTCSKPVGTTPSCAEVEGLLDAMAEPMRLQFLEGAIHFYTNFSTIHATDQGLRYEKAKAYARLGHCNRWLGRASEAELAVRTATQEFEQLIAEEPNAVNYPMELATCYSELGEMLDARLQFSQAESLYEKALALLGPCQETQDNGPGYRPRVAGIHRAFGSH